MAAFSSHHPALSLHLADPALTPLTSSQEDSTSQHRALTSLTTGAVRAHTSASRLGLGLPRRIIVETTHGGPIILHSYLNPKALRQSPTAQRDGSGPTSDAVEHLGDGSEVLSGSTTPAAGDDHLDPDGEPKLSTKIIDETKVVEEEKFEDEVELAPLLIATVVAPSYEQTGEARTAAGKLERMGVEFQRRWILANEEDNDMSNDKVDSDG